MITGGPGMGKTSLIDALTALDYTCVEESGRQLIKEQLAAAGAALPWKDQALFAEAMFAAAVKDFSQHQTNDQPVIFDRGIIDVIGYLTLCGLLVPDEMKQAAKELRYNQQVFITPPWEEIYRNDAERKQTFAEAVATYEVMKKVYAEFGYSLMELPKCTVAQRIDFMERMF